MIGAALGMAHDHCRAAGILQHVGRNVAGVGATHIPVAILATHLDTRALHDRFHPPDKRGRRANQDLALEFDVTQHAS